MKLTVKKLNDRAKIPEYMSESAAAMDLSACLDGDLVIEPGERLLVPTGLAISQQGAGYETAALLFARSGLASRHGICLSNGVGVIDSDYTGEIKVALINLSNEPFRIEHGMRIAQLMVVRAERCETEIVRELDPTGRGEGGFGSTGKQ